MSKQSIGKQIKERRKILNVTQSDLAEMANVSANTLYKIEKGQANPTLVVLDKIATILGLELTLGLLEINTLDNEIS